MNTATAEFNSPITDKPSIRTKTTMLVSGTLAFFAIFGKAIGYTVAIIAACVMLFVALAGINTTTPDTNRYDVGFLTKLRMNKSEVRVETKNHWFFGPVEKYEHYPNVGSFKLSTDKKGYIYRQTGN